MEQRSMSRISDFFYAIFFLLILSLILFFFNVITFSHKFKIVLTLLSFACLYCAGVFSCLSLPKESRERSFYKTVSFLFVLYVIIIIDFTLFDDSIGRNIFNIFGWNGESLSSYLENNVNFYPFATVRLFINAYKNGSLSALPIIENLLGNFVVFMPLAAFLPMLFKRFDKWYKFVIAVFFGSICIELLQFLFLTGSSDIDDVILNASGAVGVYFILKIKAIRRLVSAASFGVLKYEQ